MSTPRERLEAWHLAVSEGRPIPELLFAIAEDACDDLDEAREQVRLLRDAIKAHEDVMTCDDQTGLDEALDATEPKL